MTLTETPPTGLDDTRRHEVDAIVDTAPKAAESGSASSTRSRSTASSTPWSGPACGRPPSWPQVAIEETGFGVFEDKVVKNYVATEFLSDYLRDKRSVGVIDEDVERNIVHVAEPIGVVLAITPVTNPTSTVLYKAIVAAKTRNAVLFRPSPYATRCCERAVEILREAAEAAGHAAGRAAGDPGRRARGDPLPVQAPRRRLHLGHRRAEDRGAGQRRRQARPERRPRQRADLPAPHRRHRAARSSTS